MKALLVGSSFSAIPLLFDLQKRGFEVTVIGKHKTDPCHQYSEYSIFEDYSDKEKLLTIVKEGDFDFIIPSCNDYAYLSSAYVANLLKLPGFDTPSTTEILHYKNAFRLFCEENGVPVPQIYGELTEQHISLDTKITGSVLIKPVDSFSGRGMRLVHSQEELVEAAKHAFEMSRTKTALVEQYVEGKLYSHTAFIQNGKIVWYDFVDEFCEVYPYQVDRSIYPSTLSDIQKDNVHESMLKIVAALDLADGLLHTQFIASSSDHWIIETMRRCPGDLYGHQFKFSYGYDYEHEYVSGFIGEPPQSSNLTAAAKRVERRVLSSNKQRPFQGIALNADGYEICYIPLKESGHILEAAPFDKVGIVFLKSISSDDNENCITSKILDYKNNKC